MRTQLKATAAKDGSMTISEVQPVSKARTTCRSCVEGVLAPVLSLGNQYLVGFVKDIDFNAPRSPLNLMRCKSCGLLQLEHTVDPERLYREFWYRSAINDSMRTALEDVVKTGLQYHHSGRWLDIGANDGFLLSKVPPGFTKIACEPALNFADELHEIADHVISDFFSAKHECLHAPTGTGFHVEGGCDVITSAAMFYDVEDPNKLVHDIASVLSHNGIWINQLNDSPTMLQRNAFDAICHEHLCYYDLHSLESLYRRHGLSILTVTYNEVNGGSMRVIAEKPSSMARTVASHGHKRVSERDAELFAQRTEKWRERMTELVTGTLAYSNRLWAYGASTKGCALLQYLDLSQVFTGIADRNPLKFGLRMTGSWLPIMSEDEMRAEQPKHLFVLPWAFRDEFVKRERPLMDQGTTMLFPLPNIEFVL